MPAQYISRALYAHIPDVAALYQFAHRSFNSKIDGFFLHCPPQPGKLKRPYFVVGQHDNNPTAQKWRPIAGPG